MDSPQVDGVTPRIVTLPPHPALSVTPDELNEVTEEVYVPPGAMRWWPLPEE